MRFPIKKIIIQKFVYLYDKFFVYNRNFLTLHVK